MSSVLYTNYMNRNSYGIDIGIDIDIDLDPV